MAFPLISSLPSSFAPPLPFAAPLESRPGPNRTTEYPYFFNPKPSALTGIGNATTFGPLVDSVDYSLTFQKIRWGRNTWIQGRFFSNVQDLPIEDVTFCNMLYNYTPGGLEYSPLYQGRVRFSPRVKGPQPQAVVYPNVSTPYTMGDGFETVCVTVPYVKARGRQKVRFLYSSNICSTQVTFKGWVEFKNPFASLYPATAPVTCKAAEVNSAPDTFNKVRTYGVSLSLSYSSAAPSRFESARVPSQPPCAY